MKTITLELNEEAAWELDRGGAGLRQSIENVINMLLVEERKKRRAQLIEATQALQEEAEANGLTDEILQEILDEEE
jgi:hypothetical protein